MLVLALVLRLLARKIHNGTLTRNYFVGIRTAATLRSDAAWSAGHQAAEPLTRLTARVAAVTGIATLVLALSLRVAGVADSVAVTTTFVAVVVGHLVILCLSIWSAVVANRAARTHHPSSEPGR